MLTARMWRSIGKLKFDLNFGIQTQPKINKFREFQTILQKMARVKISSRCGFAMIMKVKFATTNSRPVVFVAASTRDARLSWTD